MGLFGFGKKKLEEQARIEKERQEQLKREQEKQYSLAYDAYKNNDFETAHHIWKELANQGMLSSMYSLAVTYDKGQGVKQDYKLAFDWFLKAAEQGFKEAYYGVAFCLKEGKGTQKDINKAVDYFTKAADAGIVDSEAILGYMYLYGEDIPADYEKAYHYLKLAAEHGDVDSMYHYAQMLSSEQYGHSNLYIAYLNYETASQCGHEKATNKRIECLVKGIGTVIDYDKAREIVQSNIDKGLYENPQLVLFTLEDFIKKSQLELEEKREKMKQEEIKEQNTPIISDDDKEINKDNITIKSSIHVQKGDYIIVNNKIYLVIFKITFNLKRGRKSFQFVLEDINTKEETRMSYGDFDKLNVIVDISKVKIK